MDGRNPYTSNAPDAPGSAQGGLAVISVGDWLLTFVLLAVPLVNLVALLYWSFAGAVHPSKRTFAQAGLIFAVISASFYLVSSLLAGNVLLTP
jgi:hypothetical protein